MWSIDIISDSTSSPFCRRRKTRSPREILSLRSTLSASSQQRTPERTTASTTATEASPNLLWSTLGTSHGSPSYRYEYFGFIQGRHNSEYTKCPFAESWTSSVGGGSGDPSSGIEPEAGVSPRRPDVDPWRRWGGGGVRTRTGGRRGTAARR